LDGRSRLDRDARFSILFNIRLVDEARANGWAIYTSSKGENIYGFHPSLFPLLVELVASGLDTASAAKETSDELGRLSIAAGLLDDDSPDARKRARRAADVLIRNRAFGSGVVRSYGGYCAMCGLDHGFTAGAHIYPASAPGSPDKVWNGLALCPNHHTAFDAHKIWVDPAEKSIKIHPKLLDESANNAALKAFLDCTFEKLNAPTPKAARPREEMFEKRYAYFGGRYEWV
jgi:predicted restriction endonuclease